MAMTDLYEKTLAELKREVAIGGARVPVIDALVNDLSHVGDQRLAADLLTLLSDDAQHDEGMFSLIHAAETFSDSAYIQSLLLVFPHLMQSAPRWASIVVMRALNNQATQSELVKQLQHAPGPVKQSVSEVCRRINAVSPKFLSKTIPVNLAAS